MEKRLQTSVQLLGGRLVYQARPISLAHWKSNFQEAREIGLAQ